jgi:hypothetical protein
VRQRKQLPPDPDKMNNDRAEWAGATVRHYQCSTGTDYEDVLGDLLCDLRHWCDRNNFDFEAAAFRGEGHYLAEIGIDTTRRPWPRPRRAGNTINAEMVAALELCADGPELTNGPFLTHKR